MKLARIARWLAVPPASLLIACGGSGDSPPTVVATRIDELGPIFRRASIALSKPADVAIEYQASSEPRLVVRSVQPALTHELALPRLRGGQTYSYRVCAADGTARSRPCVDGTFVTGDLPDDIRSIAFMPWGRSSYPLTFLSVRSTFNGGLVVDSDGQVVWYARTTNPPLGATRRANGNWVLLQNGIGLAEFSALGEPVATLSQARAPGGTIHHDVTATPWDTILFLAYDPREFGGQVLQGEALWEWDPQTNALRKRWSAFDFLDPAVNAGVRSVPDDWLHANSVAFGPRGNVIVSLHFLDQVISLAPDFGSIEWRLGGPGSTLSVSATQATSGQHSAREVAPNRILMFDNGFARGDGSQWSRAIELAIDPATRFVGTTWEYRPNPDIWARIISSARRLPNGNSVVTFGTPAGMLGASGPIAVHEVSPARQLLWSMTVALPNGGIFQGDPIESIGGETIVP
jgi:Arylsulfotransferase (ASST)